MSSTDLVSLALTAALVAVTLYYAIQNHSMAEAMKAQLEQARLGEVARERETWILATRPLLLAEPELGYLGAGAPTGFVTVAIGEYPALGLTLILRGEGRPDPYSAIVEVGSLAPGTSERAALNLMPFLDLSTGRLWVPGLELVVTCSGLLGQWVVEHYEWNYDDRATIARPWRLHRLEIEPRGVPGAASLDLRFGAPALFE
ncbi:MAG: hypothetical protein ACYDCI_13575 [Candidatus Limnocylindrales bacterium]